MGKKLISLWVPGYVHLVRLEKLRHPEIQHLLQQAGRSFQIACCNYVEDVWESEEEDLSECALLFCSGQSSPRM